MRPQEVTVVDPMAVVRVWKRPLLLLLVRGGGWKVAAVVSWHLVAVLMLPGSVVLMVIDSVLAIEVVPGCAAVAGPVVELGAVLRAELIVGVDEGLPVRPCDCRDGVVHAWAGALGEQGIKGHGWALRGWLGRGKGGGWG